MPTPELVERVGRALCEHNKFRPICSMCVPDSTQPNDGCRGSRYRGEAQAALKAHEAYLAERGLVVAVKAISAALQDSEKGE